MFQRSRKAMIGAIVPVLLVWWLHASSSRTSGSDAGLVPKFAIAPSPIEINRLVRRGVYFEASGRRSAVLGVEEGMFEAWVYPMKLFHDFRLVASVEGVDQNIDLANYSRQVSARPESFSITYSHPLFAIRETIFSPIDQPGSVVLLDIDSARPLVITASFVPDLKPMWPAGLGGQYAAWNSQEKAFVISESRRRYNALVGSPAATQGSTTPAHMLAAGSVYFEMKVDPQESRNHYYPIVITGNTSGREKALEQYKRILSNVGRLYTQTVEHGCN